MSDLEKKASLLKDVSMELGSKSTEQKNYALNLIADELHINMQFILSENEKDIQLAKDNSIAPSLIDRLLLTKERLADIIHSLKLLVDLPDPIGETISTTTRPNGLKIRKIRVPLGVIGMIYEARPNVTVDAASLCLKTGNAVLLRGSSSALHSNRALVHIIQQALKKSELPTNSVQLLEDTSRETAEKMFRLNDYLDVLIPRGGASLIKSVVEKASVPVLETGVGNCHMFIDESADMNIAMKTLINAKTQRPSVCNAVETALIHKKWADKHFTQLIDSLKSMNVLVKGDVNAVKLDSRITEAKEIDWETEFLDYTLALKIVDSVEEAINHIKRYGTKHSEAIISETEENVIKFFRYVDAAALYHNASTRFTDGYEFGFGAEIGISTQKLHARGPMGLEAITSTKYLIYGSGQIRQ